MTTMKTRRVEMKIRKEQEEADSNFAMLMVTPLSMGSFDEEYKESSSKKDNKDKKVSGSSVSSSRKEDNRSKTTSGSKDLCGKKKQKMKETRENTPHSSCYKK